MLIGEINLGKGISVCLIDEDGITDGYEFLSQIVDIINDKEIIISSLFYKSNVVNLNTNEKVRITFTHDSGVYSFDGKNIESINEEGILFYRISKASEIQRIQRREHFRIPLSVPIIFQFMIENEEKYGQGFTKDISGGGVKFVCDEHFQLGDTLNIFVSVSSNVEISTSGQVTRCYLAEGNKHEISLAFENLDFKQRESLIKYIFDIQRDNLKKR